MATALVTMVYDDPELLRIWVEYYSRFTDRKNMYVVTHGQQDYAAEIAAGCVIVPVHRRAPYPRMDGDRWMFLSDFASALVSMYETVICNDVDELLVLDPEAGQDPIAYLDQTPTIPVVTPFAVEVIHRWREESDLDFTRPILSQRKYARSNFWYCKPCVIRKRVLWVPDGHGISQHPNLHLDPNLYLFHLKWIDRQFHIDRYEKRVAMRKTAAADDEVLFGGSTWNKSRAQYMMMADSIEDMRIEAYGKLGFDFADDRQMYIDNFKANRIGNSKSLMKVGNDLRLIPERFIGLF